jgi:hypothetical protein
MTGFVNQVQPVLVEDTCQDYNLIERDPKEYLRSLLRLTDTVNNIN